MKIFTYLLLLWGHKKGLCKPFHQKETFGKYFKGYCSMVAYAHDLFKPKLDIKEFDFND